MISLYGASWCAPCKVVKAFLEESNYKYTYYNIEESEEAKETLADKGIRGIPTLIIEREDEVFVYTGSNINKIKELLGK